MKEHYVDISDFSPGLQVLEDATKAPRGSARVMSNMMLSDRRGLTKRPGTLLLGTANASAHAVRGLFTYKKSDGTEIMMKPYDTFLEYLHPTGLDWHRLEAGYTADQEFGFKEHLVNTDNEDYCYFCNRTEDYRRWSGFLASIASDFSAGATSLAVDTVLKSDIYYDGTVTRNEANRVFVLKSTTEYTDTANASSSTTLTVAGNPYGTNTGRWTGYFVCITSGTYSGDTRRISSNTQSQITFEALPGDPGNCTFEIRASAVNWSPSSTPQWAQFYVLFKSGTAQDVIALITANDEASLTFATLSGGAPGNVEINIRLTSLPSSGTLSVNGNEVAYSAVPQQNLITVTATTFGGVAGDPVTVKPSAYPADPRGNRLEAHYTRMFVGNVRSGLSRSAAGALQGSQSPRSYYVSRLGDASSFTFSATRAAGEGDLAAVAYGGGAITDVVGQESQVYIFTPTYIEGASYTQDGTDLLQRQQLKPGIGSVGRVIRGKNDLYFVTADNEITSLGRVQLQDAQPSVLNIGIIIKRLLDTRDFTEVSGIEYKNRLLFACKASSDDNANNRILVFNQFTGSFEGDWLLGANGFTKKGDSIYLGESISANVLQMFVGESDVRGTDTYGISSEWKGNWMNLIPKRRGIINSQFEEQAVFSMAVEGYIKGETALTFSLYKDLSEDAALSFVFTGSEEGLMTSQSFKAFLGGTPLGLEPLGAYGLPDADGFRHFSFIVHFPDIYGTFFSLGVQNDGIDQAFDITRMGLAVQEDTLFAAERIKTI